MRSPAIRSPRDLVIDRLAVHHLELVATGPHPPDWARHLSGLVGPAVPPWARKGGPFVPARAARVRLAA